MLNSVVQYFPDGEYLLRVLSGALGVLRPGGTLFVGDVRNRDLQECFYGSVALSRAEDELPVDALRRRVSRAIRQEKELVIAPRFFRLLPGALPGVGGVEVLLKQGGGDNELTRYRYDVAIRTGAPAGVAESETVLAWGADALGALERALRTGAAPVIRVSGVPNRRLARDLGVLRRLREAEGELTAGALKVAGEAASQAGATPEQFRALGARHGYEAEATWTPGADGTCFDVVMTDRRAAANRPAAPVEEGDPLDHLNDPLAARLKSAVLTELKADLTEVLPEHMVPSAFISIDVLPLTRSGKLDRKALPPPDGEAFASRSYEPPVGRVEETLAGIWAEVLGLERVGRHDNFFDLGGHSLLAVRVLERMRREGLRGDVRMLFAAPSLSGLAAEVATGEAAVAVPANLIPRDCTAITPDLLPLVSLSQEEIDRVVATVPGGAANVQDIYPLAPLQEGILFHYLMAEAGDAYLMAVLMGFADRARFDGYLAALNAVVARHDILRTGVVWEELSEPVQVVRRHARLEVEEVVLDPRDGDVAEQMRRRFDPRHYRLDVRRAPTMRLAVAFDPVHDRWVAVWLLHHLCSDHTTMEVMLAEVQAHLLGRVDALPAPLPFRNFVAQARRGLSQEEHEAFFRSMLDDVDEPTAPFGLLDVLGDGSGIAEARRQVEAGLSRRLRTAARALKVSPASLMHVAWGQVVARTSGRRDPVFGTVLFGRMQGGEGADRVMGLFLNTLPVRLRLGGASAQDCVVETHRLLGELMRHEHAPLALAKRCSALSAQAPLFTSLFNFRYTPRSERVDAERLEAWTGIDHISVEDRTNYPLTVSVDDFGADFALSVQVGGGVSAERVCAMMHRALETLVEALERRPSTPMGELDALPPEERHRLLVERNDTAAAYPQDRCIHELVEDQVAATPDATALAWEGGSLSYAELNARANRLAHHLRSCGVRPDDRVAICVERSPEMIVGLLAIMKAGGAYLPLDPAYPTDRLAFMLQDSAPVAALTHEAARATLEAAMESLAEPVPTLDLVADAQKWADRPAGNPRRGDVGLTGKNIVYITYTSGSTGKPKGIMQEHDGVADRLMWLQDTYGMSVGDVVPAKTTFCFDDSAFEFFWTLSTGAKLVITRPDAQKDPGYLVDLAIREGVTVMHFVPAVLAGFLEQPAVSACTTPRLAFCSGEELPVSMMRRFWSELPQAALHNLYGPSEAAVDATAWACDRDGLENGLWDRPGAPIGRAIKNVRIYLLDEWMEPVPEGIAGEIHVGGAGVARGYQNRPELTAERFVASPFVDGDRLYKTGDLGRYLPDGNIEFLGRNDFQVKIRGFRIELGEIEARLLEHPGVREAVVLAREDQPGDKRLVAYYAGAPEPSSELASELASLREHLSSALPDYMVPAAYVRLDALPLAPNGKVDRKALPAPDGEAFAFQAYEAPAGPAEEALARIWAEVLGVERVGRRDNFFDLGGHSLLAVRVLERMRREGLHGDVRMLFAAPTLSDLAAEVATGEATVAVPANPIPEGCTAITPDLLPLARLSQEEIDRIVAAVPGGAANIQDIYPLAPLQEGILFHHLMAEAGDAYLMRSLARFAGRDRLDAYVAAIQAMIARHDVLRTGVLWEGLPEPVQVVRRHAVLEVEEVVLDPRDGDVAEQLWARFDPRHYRLDLRRAPMMRLAVARDLDRGRWVAVWLLHHLCTDHTSVDVMLAEIQAHMLGRPDALPAPLPFRNFVVQARQRTDAAEREAFFRSLLGDVDEPTAPFGLLDVLGDGSGIAEARRPIEAGLSRRLRAAARALKVSPASLMHVAWGQVAARTSGRRDPVFGTVLFGRMQGGEGADRVMGLFLNTLPVRLRLGEASARDCVAEAHHLLGELMRHEHAPLTFVRQCSALASQAPLFTSLFNYRYIDRVEQADADAARAWEGIEHLRNEERTNYPLTVSVNDYGEDFTLVAQVGGGVSPDRVCAMMHRALETLAEALEQASPVPVGRLDVLPPDERRRLLAEWNDTAAPWPEGRCVHELFEAQVRRNPAMTAVVHGERSLSYGELNARANRVAHRLLALGVKPDDRVAVCVERSPEMVVGLLGILKAGGAYVPLDLAHPAERLAYVLRDCAPVAALTHGPARAVLEAAMGGLAARPPVVEVEEEGRGPDADPQVAGLGSRNLAYVIYTSGSTGAPKGVMVEHGSLVNRLSSTAGRLGVGPDDVFAAIAPISFDISCLELWLPLAWGFRTAIADRPTAVDGEALGDFLDRSGASIVQATPGTWRLLARGGGRRKRPFKALCGGEALPGDVRDYLLAASTEAWNVYGPTETTVWSTEARIEASDLPLDHVGRPVANTRVYLLDAAMEPVPVGVAGEICIGGPCVARGYQSRPELTAERFVASPFVDGDRLYRTGDLGRWLPDGNIEFLGRNDFQVKIRGFRIELGEIEARLLEHPGVREAVVLAREDQPGDTRLVAYHAGTAEPSSLREHLASVLPDYMVPAAYVRLDALPLTPNGKVDRKALPAPEGGAFVSRDYVVPVGAAEEALAAIWGDVLGLERVGRNDDFFDLGGHSLLAVRVVSRIRQDLGIDVGVRAVFDAPTVAGMRSWLAASSKAELDRYEQASALLAAELEQMSDDEILARLQELGVK
ncbi:non-ribosomal peptide synthetase [Arenibaculum sp.]|uniref:non-ribosomal peptide synthetase n=1 Tax=Arenibaculum sp. TaxID=2865862 RepID=UPI002E1299AA|nr:non-ribosomal peptide synthetase [Arenibaculum sp.]HEV7367751.1 amino acid adenylation domain-containing protein [Arenibaculum sp.]